MGPDGNLDSASGSQLCTVFAYMWLISEAFLTQR